MCDGKASRIAELLWLKVRAGSIFVSTVDGPLWHRKRQYGALSCEEPPVGFRLYDSWNFIIASMWSRYRWWDMIVFPGLKLLSMANSIIIKLIGLFFNWELVQASPVVEDWRVFKNKTQAYWVKSLKNQCLSDIMLVESKVKLEVL